MSELTISLSDRLLEYVETRASERGYATPREFVEDLVRDAADRDEHARLETLLLDGVNSGPPVHATPEYWEELEAEARQRRSVAAPP